MALRTQNLLVLPTATSILKFLNIIMQDLRDKRNTKENHCNKHLACELWIFGIDQQDGFWVGQGLASSWQPIIWKRHNPLPTVFYSHVIKPINFFVKLAEHRELNNRNCLLSHATIFAHLRNVTIINIMLQKKCSHKFCPQICIKKLLFFLQSHLHVIN